MSQRVLVTGIGGSIGIHVFYHLMQETDWQIIGIDSFRHKGLSDRISCVLANHADWASRLSVFTHDLTAPISDLMRNKIGPVDFVINLAALSDVEDSIRNPGHYISSNVQIAVTMLEYARWLLATYKAQDRLKVFFQVSTDEVYGPSGERDRHPEWSPILPSNPYAASKAAQEACCISYWRCYGIPLIIGNTMNNFGEFQQSKKFPALVQSKILNGDVVIIHGNEQTIGSRYYLHSRSHADAILFLLTQTTPYLHQEGQIDRPDRYNIVGEKRINNLELATMIGRFMNREFESRLEDFHLHRPGHDRHYGLDGSKLAALGWKAPTSLESSLKDTVEWGLEHPEWLDP